MLSTTVLRLLLKKSKVEFQFPETLNLFERNNAQDTSWRAIDFANAYTPKWLAGTQAEYIFTGPRTRNGGWTVIDAFPGYPELC